MHNGGKAFLEKRIHKVHEIPWSAGIWAEDFHSDCRKSTQHAIAGPALARGLREYRLGILAVVSTKYTPCMYSRNQQADLAWKKCRIHQLKIKFKVGMQATRCTQYKRLRGSAWRYVDAN